MPRTRVPDDLIHRPEQVERNAKRFDDLCRLTEEVAFPIVREALFREYHETAATGAEVLTNEAKQTLEALAEEAALVEDLDEKLVLQAVQRSLSEATPPPDEEECLQHAREYSQVLMSTWLEILRDAQSKASVLLLSDRLLPEIPLTGMTWFVESIKERIGSGRSKLPQLLIDAIGWSAANEVDTAEVMTTLRDRLFQEPRLVDLPFDLAMIGAPWLPVLVSTRAFFEKISPSLILEPESIIDEPPDVEPVSSFVTVPAQSAISHLSEPLAKAQYGSMVMTASASLQTKSMASEVEHAVEQALKPD